MMDELTVEGPFAYENWKALLSGKQPLVYFEYPFFTDAHITGEISEGLGPYRIINAVPITRSFRPTLVLRVSQHLEHKVPFMKKTKEDNYHGGFLADEIAALFSLFLGIRLKSGDANREFSVGGDPFGRPRSYGFYDDPILPEIPKRPILKSALGTHSLDITNSLSFFPQVSPHDAIAIIRAARLYQEAVWMVESTPELSWILLTSAIETVAQKWRDEKESPLERLRASRPELEAKLKEHGDEEFVLAVANDIAPYMGATKTFVDFLMEFMPPPPSKRPDKFAQLSWETPYLKKVMTLIYKYRSRALHGGFPFPAPMCEPPHYYAGREKAPEETSESLATGMRGGVWLAKDVPILLHTFEYIARNAIINWWRTLETKS